MIFLRFSLVLLGCFAVLPASDANDDLGSVIFASVIFRHGDRTPIDPYPNDPWRNQSHWPVPFGQLTNLGKHQHLELGRWLRNRYNHILSSQYSPSDIYVQSTDVDRTLMSAEANLAGLYPPEGDQVWDSLKWMPIPVHTVPGDYDNLLSGKKYCARYDYELEQVLLSPVFVKLRQDNAKLFKYLTEKTGRTVNSLKDVTYIYDTLFIEEIYEKQLPAWTKSVYPDKLKPLAGLAFAIPAYNHMLQRLKVGLLINDIVSHMQAKSTNSLVPDRKVWIYSAHDDTVANTLMALGLFEPHCPPYTATILIELRENSMKQKIVTVSYKNSSEPRLLTVPGCIEACPLEQFVKLTKNLIPENWEKECTIDWGLYASNSGLTAILCIIMMVIFVLLFCGFAVMAIVVCYYQQKDKREYYYLTQSPYKCP